MIRHRGPRKLRRHGLAGCELLEGRQLLATLPLISEFMAANQATLQDDDGDFSDWIEIQNPSDDAADLRDWHLTDDPDDLTRWTLPDITLAAGEFLIIHASGKDRAQPGATLHTNFRLDGDGEYLALVMPDGQQVASSYAPQFPPQVADVSYGWSADLGQRGYLPVATPGTMNPPQLADDPLRSIVINEIMYHPASEDDAHEFVELWNPGAQEFSLDNWQITGGLEYEFPDVTLEPGQYLVVAADVLAFPAVYGEAADVVGPWTGRLSNSSDTITLRDAHGRRVDRVTYADEGEWTRRVRGPDDRGHQGWIWLDDHDGGGKSLELSSATLSNESGQNWDASLVDLGTPGQSNSVAATNVAPLILEGGHQPAIPRADESVVVQARIQDEQAVGTTATLHWRVDGQAEFQQSPMRDDGLEGDLLAGDGTHQAILPALPDRTVVEYYVRAEDAQGLTRTWPAPTADSGQVTNALYQVIDEFDSSVPWEPGSPPVYYEIMTATEREEFTNIVRRSDAQMNATFVSVNGDGIKVRHNMGVRIRGQGSRNHNPPNNRVNFPGDRSWQGVTAVNVNAVVIQDQIAGSTLFRLAGLPAAQATAVRMFSNGVNLYGEQLYAHLETLGGDYAANHFPLDPNGNLYRGNRANNSPPGGMGAGLAYHGPDPEPYVSYSKFTNESQADWSDVIELTDVLNNAPDEAYLEQVAEVVDIDQWLRFFALNALLGNTEGGLVNGDRQGDDYAMYRGIEDPRFRMVPHDLDSLFSGVTRGIFNATNVPALRRLILHPEIRPRYYEQLHDLIDNVLLTQETEALLREELRHVSSGDAIDGILKYLRDRSEYVRSITPSGVQIESLLPTEQGILKSTEAATELHGVADYRAQSVLVNGQLAEFNTSNQWQLGSFIANIAPFGSTWRYLDDGSDQGEAWRDLDFAADESWKEGRAQLGYGDNDERTVVDFGPDAENKHVTTYFRHEFELPDASRYVTLIMQLLRDDGAVVYLNDMEVIRSNLPSDEAIAYQTLATENIAGSAERARHTFQLDPALLRDGTNVLAVEVHQAAVESADLSFDLRLYGRFRTNGGISLQPGLSRVLVQAMSQAGGQGEVVAEEFVDIWHDDGDVVPVTGELPAGETVWTAAEGPYHVDGQLVVPADARLTVEPGTSVFFERGAELLVHGTLVAQGQQHARIRFGSIPGAPFEQNRPGGKPGLPDGPPRWQGIHLVDSMSPDNVIAYADIEYAQDGDGSIGVNSSSVLVDNVTFRGTHLRMIYGNNASLVVRNSTFPDVFGPDEDPVTVGLDNLAEPIKIIGQTPAGGQLVIEHNTFGTNKGHNDVIDADSNRVSQGPILQILNNVFHGAGDELLDLGGDVYVAGNVFLNVHKDEYTSDHGYASVISTGDAGSNTTVVVARNIFYAVDHAINLKNWTATIFENNTVVNVNPDFVDRFDELNVSSVVNLFKEEPNATPGKGAYLAGNIFWDVPRVFGNVDQPGDHVSQLELTGNLLSQELAGTPVGQRPGTVLQLGSGNRVGDPRLRDPAGGDFRLRAGSDATGDLSALDWGAMVPEGAWIRGEPTSSTSLREANLTVGGPGIFAYRYRVNSGAWSEPIPLGSGFDPQGTVRSDTISLSGLADGDYTVEVVGQDFAGNWQSTPTVSRTWTVQDVPVRLMIHEILVSNQNTLNHFGSHPDLVELHNAGTTDVNLRGYSLTDDVSRPTRFVFQQDLLLPAGGYLTLMADDRQTPGTHLGFSLKREGESVQLFAPPVGESPRELVDSVTFGLQIPDFSLGRVGQTGEWALTEPTFGQANRAALTGDVTTLKVNEWLAGSDRESDFVELYNPDPLPVALGGLFLSDAPDGSPGRHELSPLSFMAGRSFQAFQSEADQQDSDHLGFRLDLHQGTLGLRDAQLGMINTVVYGPQTRGVSQGRLPDGATGYAFFALPSPGWINGGGTAGDFNRDGQIDAIDIDLLAATIRSGGEPDDSFDLNRDTSVDFGDLSYLVGTLLNTTFGDANLDGIFNSSDMVQVFQAGEYEDGQPGNSGWREGDWNGDGDFGTQDMVVAFQMGGYTAAARPATRDISPAPISPPGAVAAVAAGIERRAPTISSAARPTVAQCRVVRVGEFGQSPRRSVELPRRPAVHTLHVDDFFANLGREPGQGVREELWGILDNVATLRSL